MAPRSILVVLCFLSATYCRPVDESPKVQIGLYYESLCPDCQLFITKQLYPAFRAVGAILHITLVPYGNAEETREAKGEWKFFCQHGHDECVGNIIETCAISGGNISQYLPFVYCFEKNISESWRQMKTSRNSLHEAFMEVRGMKSPASVAAECAKQLGIDYGPIDKCQAGPQGNQLEHEMAVKTDTLDPPHRYTPWITLNGLHTEKIQNQAEKNLLKLVCETYTGPKPPACVKASNILH